ncbi:ATP-binding protein [Porticoccaceae bacterium]|nr:ATP-binding protein [Porticoccaceae bacterium]
MTIQTNLHGRLRNTPLPRSHGLLPLFEAVVNSIHSIEDLHTNLSEGKITVEIIRDTQSSLDIENDKDNKEKIIGFRVSDNGVGFNDENMDSFETLDSELKASKGCRGVGRLLWLKAFSRVEVNSVFKKGEGFRSRSFRFDASNGVSSPEDQDVKNEMLETVVHLDGFKKNYQEATGKTLNSISRSLLEHCLWYFVRETSSPQIILQDDGDAVNLDDLYDEYMHSSANSETVIIKENKFEITHIKFRSTSKNHSVSFCAANRLVKEDNITGKIPGLIGRISDDKGDFVYSCYISSPYLDEKVRSERTGFDIEDRVDGLFSKTEISIKDIYDSILPRIGENLKDHLLANIEAGKKRVEDFVSKKAPRYRPVLSRMSKESLAVDPSISDKDLDMALHKQLSKIERKLLEDGHSVMSPKEGENVEDYQTRLKEYLETASDIKKSDLANYVSHRRVILDLLDTAIQRGDDGKYAREDIIHELIMPMRQDSNGVALEDCNLWLLDERLAFHDYLASDKTLSSMPITGSNETKEPDLCALNVCDNPILFSEGQKLPLASIVVVEIKRPMRNDARPGEEKDPIEQALGYLNRVRNGRVNTAAGRPIPNSNDIPGYCYIICDLTESVVNRCEFLDLTVTSDHMGYFGFHKQFKAYIEVVSFDRLVNSAKERNRAFFDRLGLPV